LGRIEIAIYAKRNNWKRILPGLFVSLAALGPLVGKTGVTRNNHKQFGLAEMPS